MNVNVNFLCRFAPGVAMNIKTNPDLLTTRSVYSVPYEPGRARPLSPEGRAMTRAKPSGRPGAKRLFDLVVGGAILICILPLLPLIALAIRIDSPGPVFFRQARTGQDGVPFRIFKFRTMTAADSGAGFRQAQRGDNRITRVGGFLRRSSLDELPQLFNVLLGDMSLVGPRPHVRELDEWAMQHVPEYTGRWAVKPGITGWAQVLGFRGETPTPDVMRQRVEADIWYAHNATVALDIKILFRTLLVVLGQKNAF